ncbi:DNA repair protein RadA [Candidatus Saccharibacteria bacterium]|nr:DNA repair protein RadA [Candidatus Saccharibacteria bacterium]MCB9834778.1 DNA repair protein RadA [Candidatus Nomurabacteria bacterium]
MEYICQNCQAKTSRWSGKCLQCGSWDSLKQLDSQIKGGVKSQALELIPYQEIKHRSSTRLSTGIKSLDQVFGGGIVPGSISLLSGQPGIGKSTLLGQLALNLSAQSNLIYLSGEESKTQLGMRLQRLTTDGIGDRLMITTDTRIENLIGHLADGQTDLVIIDSVQTIRSGQIDTVSGSVSQITTVTNLLVEAAKLTSTAIILVGQVTKGGDIAGPKLLEHMVDTVLHLDGDRNSELKILMASKNRFGNNQALAIFAMGEKGMEEVSNPSERLLEFRQDQSGSIVYPALEGNRSILIEVQALINKTNFGYPKRTSVGFDLNRLQMLIAVLSKRAKLKLDQYDVYINLVGGIKVDDPGVDLAVAAAIISIYFDQKLGSDLVVFGEVGLSGEIRPVRGSNLRLEEAKKMGLKRAIMSGSSKQAVKRIEDLLGLIKQ